MTADNLQKLQNQPFITRLPATYKVEKQCIEKAFESGQWEELGALAESVDPSKKRKSARYKICETTLELYETTYRSIVVHSDAHDKRRLKKLDKELANEKQVFEKLNKAASKEILHCQADAQQRIDTLIRENSFKLHRLNAQIIETPVYARGRPKLGNDREIKTMQYHIELILRENEQQINAMRERSGCFVILSNVPNNGELAHSGCELLKAYKEQYGIEINFRFLKDPVIVNDTFLKKAERIEALGFILLLSLLVWNLIQHLLREHLKKHQITILGWDNKPTERPTTLMVIFYFQHISIFRWNEGRNRRLSRALKDHQRDYLRALGIPETIFTTPVKSIRSDPPELNS